MIIFPRKFRLNPSAFVRARASPNFPLSRCKPNLNAQSRPHPLIRHRQAVPLPPSLFASSFQRLIGVSVSSHNLRHDRTHHRCDVRAMGVHRPSEESGVHPVECRYGPHVKEKGLGAGPRNVVDEIHGRIGPDACCRAFRCSRERTGTPSSEKKIKSAEFRRLQRFPAPRFPAVSQGSGLRRLKASGPRSSLPPRRARRREFCARRVPP